MSNIEVAARRSSNPESDFARPDVRLGLELVSAWNDARDDTVWSGTISSLLRELESLDALGTPGYRDVTPWPAALRAAYRWLGLTRRLSAAWTLEPEVRIITSLYALFARLTATGANGALLPVGAIGRPVRRPFCTWCDMSPAQIATAFPDHIASIGYPDVNVGKLRAVLRQQASIFRRSDCCLAVSSWAAQSLVKDHGINPERVRVVGAGRNLTPPAPPDRRWTPPKYLFVGNNWERKNGEGVVRAFGSLRTFVPDAELHLVGDHPDVRAPGVTAHGRLSFSIPDQRAELESLFCASTCFVMPSWLEAFGIVYVEAAAAGLPSIGTTVGGTETSIGDGGILVDPADDRGLLEAMRQLAEPQFAHKLGTRARQRADAFTWRACAERVVRAFAPDLADDLGMADFLSVQHR